MEMEREIEGEREREVQRDGKREREIEVLYNSPVTQMKK